MVRNSKWLVALGVTVLAFGLLFGTAMADPGDGGSENGGWNMHEQMDPEQYGQMIQRMTEVHGAEFTAEMLQRMNEGGNCHGAGEDMMGHGMMGAGMMSGFHGLMGGSFGHGSMMDQGFEGTVGRMMRGVHGLMSGFGNDGMMGR